MPVAQPAVAQRGASVRIASSGQIAIAMAPTAVQARCCGVEPWTGSGLSAMPMADRPAITNPSRARRVSAAAAYAVQR